MRARDVPQASQHAGALLVVVLIMTVVVLVSMVVAVTVLVLRAARAVHDI
jgi:flagellar biosynthesis protein FliQ